MSLLTPVAPVPAGTLEAVGAEPAAHVHLVPVTDRTRTALCGARVTREPVLLPGGRCPACRATAQA